MDPHHEPHAKTRFVQALPGILVLFLALLALRFYWGPWYVRETFDIPLWISLPHWVVILGVLAWGAVLALRGARGRYGTETARKLAGVLPLLVPRINAPVALLAAVILATNGLYLGVVQYRECFYLGEPLTWACLAYCLVFETALFLAVVLGLTAIGARALAVVAAFSMIACRLADALVYYFARGQLEAYHLQYLGGVPLETLDWRPLLALGAWVLLGTGATAAVLYRRPRALPARGALRWSLFTLLLVVIAPHFLYYSIETIWHSGAYAVQYHRSKFAQLEKSMRNSPYNLFLQLTRESDPERVEIAASPEGFQDAIRDYSLPIGPRSYAPIPGNGPYERVILIALESLSNALIAPLNPALQSNNTPHFFSSPEVAARLFTRYRPSDEYTEQGLTMMLTSHPNAELSAHTKWRAAFTHRLREAGWATLLVRADSRFYASGQVLFGHAGFDRIVALEEFQARSDTRSYCSGWWGLCDRLVHEEVLRQLEAHRGEKLFVMVYTVDTHLPNGREDRHGLPYPEYRHEPEVDDGGPHMLRSAFCADFDLHLFVEKLKSKGLWDEKTLLIVTGDHAAPLSASWGDVPGYPRDRLHPIPLAILSPRALSLPDCELLGCQLDLAPTLLHLLGLEIPAGYWGSSLFAAGAPHGFIGTEGSLLRMQSAGSGGEIRIDTENPGNAREEGLAQLFWTLITDGLPGSPLDRLREPVSVRDP